jgi:flagellin-like hook-associated protein FlgL
MIALVTLTQELGHLPTVDEINEHGEYRHQRYREEFGDLFNAYQAAGILPDDVTRADFYGEEPAEPSEPDESEAEPTSKSKTRSEAAQEPDSEGEAEAEKDTSQASATSTETDPSRQELLDEIKRLDASLDRIPYQSDVNQDGRFTAYTFRDRFGSWDEALEAAGIDKEAVLVEDMQQVADTVDGDISQPAMNEHGKYSASMAARFFGSWSDAKERFEEWEASKDEQDVSAAESADIDTSSTDLDRPGFDVPADINESDLVAEIQRFAEIIDEPPTKELVVTYGRYPADAYREAFGSWDSALETAGYDPEDIPDWDARSQTNTEIMDGLRAVADELGHAPTTTETGNHVDFSPGLASLRFGSWSDALETAGLDPSERSSVQDRDASEQEDETADDRESVDDVGGDEKEKHDPIGSVIDDTLENMLLSDDEDGGPL